MKDIYLESLQQQVFEAAKVPKKKPLPTPDADEMDEEKEDMVVDKYQSKLYSVARSAANMSSVERRVKIAVKAFMSKIPKDEQKILAIATRLDWESRSHEPQSQSEFEEILLDVLKPYEK